jgi:hypothetical protein
MRAPDTITTRRSVEEIADDILKRFDEEKDPITPTEVPDISSLPDAAAKVLRRHHASDQTVGFVLDVQSTIRKMCAVDRGAPLWGNRAENLRALKALNDHVERLQRSLRDMPDTLRVLLFASGEIDGIGTDVPSTEMQDKITARLRATVTMLALLRHRCSQLTVSEPGIIHGNADYRKELAAGEAHDFLGRWGKRPASPKSETSLFRNVSALLYEGLTGEQGSNLERACIEVHQRRTEKSE